MERCKVAAVFARRTRTSPGEESPGRMLPKGSNLEASREERRSGGGWGLGPQGLPGGRPGSSLQQQHDALNQRRLGCAQASGGAGCNGGAQVIAGCLAKRTFDLPADWIGERDELAGRLHRHGSHVRRRFAARGWKGGRLDHCRLRPRQQCQCADQRPDAGERSKGWHGLGAGQRGQQREETRWEYLNQAFGVVNRGVKRGSGLGREVAQAAVILPVCLRNWAQSSNSRGSPNR